MYAHKNTCRTDSIFTQDAAFIGATTCGIIHLHGYAVRLIVGVAGEKPKNRL
jgi:hypothetical protein